MTCRYAVPFDKLRVTGLFVSASSQVADILSVPFDKLRVTALMIRVNRVHCCRKRRRIGMAGRRRSSGIMLNLIQAEGTGPVVAGEGYVLRVLADGRVRIEAGGRPFADFSPVSAVNGPGGTEDTTTGLTGPSLQRYDGRIELVWTSGSTLWERKTYRFTCCERHVGYTVEAAGQGTIGNVDLFSGKQKPAGPPSRYYFSRFMSTEITLLDRRYYKSWEYACIDACSGPTREIPREPEDNNHWLFTPPPFVYAWNREGCGWLGVGLAPRPGEYTFTGYRYIPADNAFRLSLAYDGMTAVDGEWRSPEVLLMLAADEYEAVRACCRYVYEQGLAVRPERQCAPWWNHPIFCGWGEQVNRWVREGGAPSDYSLQENYDRFMAGLDAAGIYPGTVVIDDRWQRSYGVLEPDTTRWPSLRDWIERRHSRGQHVLLWMMAWGWDGLPPEECIRRADSGDPVTADPSSPAYEKRLREMIRKVLSSGDGCLNADGFKVDFTHSLPAGEGFTLHGKLWGVELLKRLMSIIYDEAKRTKPDALIITHTANPYFAETTDMLRLNDISPEHRGVVEMMRHRQKIAMAACPDWLIDCDNASAPTLEEWLEYMKAQPELGVPSLYFVTAVNGTLEEIGWDEWAELPEVWRRGRAGARGTPSPSTGSG